MKLERLTEAEAVALVHKKLVSHALSNPGVAFEQIIDDVVAYFVVRFGLQRAQGHAMMAVFIPKHLDAVIAELRAKGMI